MWNLIQGLSSNNQRTVTINLFRNDKRSTYAPTPNLRTDTAESKVDSNKVNLGNNPFMRSITEGDL